MDIISVNTKPYTDQVFGTSGVRKKVSVFKQENYVNNLVQSVFDCLDGFEGKTLVIGGDGRYYNYQALQDIVKLAIANQFGRIIVGQDGILSTPATSHVIVKYNAVGGFILSASHNPGGAEGDFGLKYDNANGAPAPQELTDRITKRTQEIERFWTVDIPDIDFSKIGEQAFGQTVLQVISSTEDYISYMQSIFDFSKLKKLFKSGFTMTFNAMNAVTGPYAIRIFEEILGAQKGTVINEKPLPNFGGRHPEPNLTYAKDLVDLMHSDKAPDFGAASDGDGDRYMIMGKSFFMNPSDSLAILTQYLDTVPFYKGKIKGVARSLPTSFAVDDVAKEQGIDLYQTPTGWKFFGNLITADRIAICGEESFGAGSCHLQEKDGIWAVLCWLSILSETGKTVEQLAMELWQKHGRIFSLLYDYAGLDKKDASDMMNLIGERLPTLIGTTVKGEKITDAYVFSYHDPVTGEVAENQGICIYFGKDTRLVMRLSGTSSVGATFKVYMNKRIRNVDEFTKNPQDILKNLSDISLEISELKHLTGVEKPSMMT
jgi:phosphoglucomutase